MSGTWQHQPVTKSTDIHLSPVQELVIRVRVCKPRASKYLSGKVFGFPGSGECRALPLLCSLPLFQAVLVLRGSINVPLLQRVGDMLPQTPAQGQGAQGGVRRALLSQPSAAGHQSGEQQAEATLSTPVFQVPQLGNHHSPRILITFVDQIFRFTQLPVFCHAIFSADSVYVPDSLPPELFSQSRLRFIFIISSSHSLLIFLQSPDDRCLILGFFAVRFLNYKGVSAKTQECTELGHWLVQQGH